MISHVSTAKSHHLQSTPHTDTAIALFRWPLKLCSNLLPLSAKGHQRCHHAWPVTMACPSEGQPVRHLLLHLVAAVGAGEADNHLQLLGGVVHKLLLEGSLLGPRGPGQPLIQVQQPVHAQGEWDHFPAYRFPNLKNKIFISLNKLPYGIKANFTHF